MQITVSGKNFDVSDSLRDHVVEKLNKKTTISLTAVYGTARTKRFVIS